MGFPLRVHLESKDPLARQVLKAGLANLVVPVHPDWPDSQETKVTTVNGASKDP